MKVARRKFPLFLSDFGAILYFFFRANCCGQQSIKGEEWRFTTGLYECHRALFRGGGGGGERSFKVYIDTAKIFPIRFEFSPIALETLTSHRNKISLCQEIQHIHVLPSILSKTSSLLKSVCKDELKATRNKATPLNRTGQKWKPTRSPLIL